MPGRLTLAVASALSNLHASWRISDRLTKADIHSIASSYRAGTTARKLAEQLKISKSSVKQILRDRGIRRTSPAA
ncbi:MAG: helix-turn-helix domain-containing protein [Pseudonocardiaceae bacterium]